MTHTLRTTIILPALTLLALLATTACSSDNDSDLRGSKTITIDIPIDIYSASGSQGQLKATATQGDPGNDASFKAPLWLYVVAFVSENDGSDYEILTKTLSWADDDEANGEWTLQDEGKREERWHKNVRVTFNISRAFNNSVGASRVYAIASRTDLSTLLPADITSFTSMTDLEGITLDMSSLTAIQLGDTYSTPAYDRSTPAQASDNGNIAENNKSLTCSTVKLYHVAAKTDFTWEVDASLRKTTELKSIVCTGLPTTCKVFKPTENPVGTATATVLGTAADNAAVIVDEGNKWTGRAYTYVLQPPSPGTVNYTVTYGGSAGRAETNKSSTPATGVYNNVFTGWYRITATVK